MATQVAGKRSFRDSTSQVLHVVRHMCVSHKGTNQRSRESMHQRLMGCVPRQSKGMHDSLSTIGLEALHLRQRSGVFSRTSEIAIRDLERWKIGRLEHSGSLHIALDNW
jgi:hypothetical protein